MRLAVVGGTGLADFAGVEWLSESRPKTTWGQPSAPVRVGKLTQGGESHEFLFLPRHGQGHTIAPHLINYRANVAALKAAGATHIIAVNAVGGLTAAMDTEVLAIPDQLIDYSHSRESTFFDGRDGSELRHIDFTHPYCERLRQTLISAANDRQIEVVAEGVYGCTQGPRLETAAEVRRLMNDGCDLVGMTAMPEASLARELDMSYASICLVVNRGAGLTRDIITMADIERVVNSGMAQVRNLIGASLLRFYATARPLP
ncbi:S-methyl-5'-thioinosine phosphorylase [Pseudomaricurvus alkylphenolicus]|jgi:5'-methylthioinosine phosphorylase|uniref:S-methyl-5'-thioinosine phosphorylase n=1 Tax=Pseudomaricurvus alkylphenolicus TaxID=1306991 RepID=UPI001423194F|nr:S-methyl-5'-thioinosine phosphorylase [Pseudomaricurvus alkylphenolicus]NIB41280.1 S-methyl-5'-thioinosine phosphorylase [Pseudomaricurvus alkylphenolicus]